MIIDNSFKLSAKQVGDDLERFYYEVDNRIDLDDKELVFPRKDIELYAASIFQGTNDRTKRIDRANIISSILERSISQ